MIKINNLGWRVFLVSPTHFMLRTDDDNYALGCCDNETRSIYINDMLNAYYMKKVLCHEIVHAAAYSYNVILTLEEEELIASMIDTYGEEIIEITNEIFSQIKNGSLLK